MSLFGLFLEGLLSFFSPCVLPLVPLYMSYLSSDAREIDENGKVKYKTTKVFLMTLFFVLGISVVFLLLALSTKFIKPIIEKYINIISLLGGLIIVVLGLHQTGLINIKFLDFERKINSTFSLDKMNYLKAFMIGFLFSFAWTPCIGPMLASAIILATTSKFGSLYILVYALGLVAPFLITGLFTSKVLNLIKNKKNIFKYVMIVSGVILIAYGFYMIYDSFSNMKMASIERPSAKETVTEKEEIYLPNDEFLDQNGNIIRFDDYKDKVVFLNFTTTWCTYCEQEIPEYISFSNEYDDVACFYVMNSYSSGVDEEKLIQYINEHQITIPVIIDEDNILYGMFNPSSFPTLFVADKEGKLMGYLAGALDKEGFNDVLEKVR